MKTSTRQKGNREGNRVDLRNLIRDLLRHGSAALPDQQPNRATQTRIGAWRDASLDTPPAIQGERAVK